MSKWEAIVVIDGCYRGWVGYFLENEDDLYAKVRLLSSEDGATDDVVAKEYLKSVEPA